MTYGYDQPVESSHPVRGKERAGQYDPDTHDFDDSGQTSRTARYEQVGSGGTFSPENRQDRNKSGKSDIGGILSQLRHLQQVHLAYVDSHRERLEKRLEENKEHRRLIEEDMKRLENTVIDLLQQQEGSE